MVAWCLNKWNTIVKKKIEVSRCLEYYLAALQRFVKPAILQGYTDMQQV